ncbi:hypothetical protein [Ruminococcus albus]|uniref:hypothetical protein n=1 Tax=Ruminococcus albus TaxID=1264 RepID=UPI0012D2EBBE|nr:hypothetical protein [Ruminococcus albus]
MSAKKKKKNKTTASSVCRVNKNANYTVMSNSIESALFIERSAEVYACLFP